MKFSLSASRRALVAGLGLAALPLPALAQTFTVPAGTTDTTPKTLSGTQTGTVQAGATLRSTSGTAAIGWNNASTDVIVTNNGTIENTSTGRAFDSSGGSTSPRTLTFLNNIGAIVRASAQDAIRINTNVTSGTILIDNAGLIQAGGTGYAGLGQALDLRTMASNGVNLTIINRATGTIEALTDDALRPGQNAVVNNYGIIRSFGANTSGGANGTADAIDAGARTGIVVTNFSGGLISGARHGITADNDITVVNQSGGVILGRNGSGVGSDGAGTVTNYGRITGAYAGVGNIFNSDGLASVNGDGDGVDLDLAGTIINHGIIEGTGAGGFDSGGRANASEGISIGGGTITNYGLIFGANAGIVVNNDTNPDRSGVAATTIINNAGATIIGATGYAIRLENKLGDARDNDTIVNRGTIIGNGAIPDPNAVVLLQNGTPDPNSVGTLNGVVYTGTGSARFIRGDGSAIQMGEGADILTNYGVIIGNNGRAVNLEGGNDTLNVFAGSRITGLVDGGAGTDTLNYNKVGLTEAKRAQLQAGQTVNIGGTLYTSFETVNGAALPYASFGRTSGAVAVGGLFDNLPATTPGSTAAVNLLDAVAGAADVGSALAQLSPASYQNLSRLTLGSASQSADLIGNRLTQNRLGLGGTDTTGAARAFAALDSGLFDRRAPTLSRSLADVADPFASLAYAPVTKAPAAAATRVDAAADTSLFLTSGLVYTREGARPDAPAFRATSANIVGGVDHRFTDRFTLGAFGGYGATNGDTDAIGSTARIRTGTVGGYASYAAPRWYANVLGLLGWSDNDTRRLALGTVNTASFGSNHYAVRGAVGTDLLAGRYVVTPEASLQYTQLNTDAFAEAGGAAALNVAADRLASLRSSVGARIATDYRTASGLVTPELRAAWLHEFADRPHGITANFIDVSLPGSFITTTASGLRDRGLVGAGVTGRFNAAISVSLNYDVVLGASDAVTHQLVGRIRGVF